MKTATKRNGCDKYCPEKHGRLLTPKEAAKLIGNSEKTLATWRSEGHGPTYLKRTGRIHYPEKLAEIWVEENSVLVIAKQ